MPVYQFPEIVRKGCGTTSANKYRLTIATLQRSDYSITWAAPISATYNPFTDIPDFGDSQSPMAGAQEVGRISFKCTNLLFDTGFRVSTMFTDYNPYDFRWIIRLEIWDGVSAYDHWKDFLVDHEARIEMLNPDDLDTWTITFSASDIISIYDEVTVDAVVQEMPHATYDYNPSAIQITWIDGGTPQAHLLLKVSQNDRAGADEWRTANELRFFNLMDVIGAFHRAMGFATAINNGGALDHDWVYTIREGGVDYDKAFEDLYITSALYYNTAVYQQFWTFFDSGRWADHSFYNCGSALEMLKMILIPHGLTAAMKTNSSGAWYLEIRQFLINQSNTISNWRRGSAELSPADRTIRGLVVNTSNDYEWVRGTSGDGADSIKCVFTSAARLRRNGRWQVRAGDTDDLPGLHSALWALNGTVMHNVYKVTVKSHGQTGASGTITPPEWSSEQSGLLFSQAAAAYYYNPVLATTDVIGIHRPVMRRLQFTVAGIYLDTAVGEYISWNSLKWWVLEVKWSIKNNTTTFICETGEW